MRRIEIGALRYPARYVDNTTRRQAILSTEAALTVGMLEAGLRVGKCDYWYHGHEVIGWRVSITALVNARGAIESA